MKSVVIVSPKAEKWGDFASALSDECHMDVTKMRTGKEAIYAAKEKKTIAMVIDQNLGGLTGIGLVYQLLQVDAFVHIALVSDQAEEAFHEATEGLGLLMKLSPCPSAQEAIDFYERLRGVI